ncbi:MAG: nucleotide exchange factor GrpE [Blastocatellia bacterium]|nr:nucleotide exchange factor GrpE [Blastocatellia bacterium]
MRSKPENQENSQEETLEEQEAGNEGQVRVTDKRRIDLVDDSSNNNNDNNDNDEGESLDVVAEAENPAALEILNLQAKLKEAEEKRIEAERQVRDISERFRQAQAQLKAETEEQRTRMQRVFEQKLEAARGDIVVSLLESLDNLKRAIAAAEKSERREADFEALLEGVRATASLFEAKMLGLGLKPVSSVGELFNPEIHEAVEIVSVSTEEDNHVVEEFQTGYKFGDRLLRPARVRVGRAVD